MSEAIPSSHVTAEELDVARTWARRITGELSESSLRHASDLPFSFTCGTRSSREWVQAGAAAVESSAW